MLKLLENPAALAAHHRPVCAAIGVFDGVHLGHRQVLQQTLDEAGQREGIPIAITFDVHPAKILFPERAPRMIYPLEKKLALLEALGFEHALLIRFTPEFSRIEAGDFIRDLANGFKPLSGICVGSGFTFGRRRSGNVELLHRLGSELSFTVSDLAAVALDAERVSSTRIRKAVAEGRLGDASQMLGRSYTLGGSVIHGDQLGRQLGFPTANLDVADLVIPPPGVYAAHALHARGNHRAAVNIGMRPTLSNPNPCLHVEAHLTGFDGDLYGQSLELQFVRRLRSEMKFPNLNALKEQIAKDVALVRGGFD